MRSCTSLGLVFKDHYSQFLFDIAVSVAPFGAQDTTQVSETLNFRPASTKLAKPNNVNSCAVFSPSCGSTSYGDETGLDEIEQMLDFRASAGFQMFQFFRHAAQFVFR